MGETIIFKSDFKTNEILKEKGFLTGKKGKQTSNLSEYLRGLIQADQSYDRLIESSIANVKQQLNETDSLEKELQNKRKRLQENLIEMEFRKKKIERREEVTKKLGITSKEAEMLSQIKEELLANGNKLQHQVLRLKDYNDTFGKEITRQQLISLLNNLE